MNVPFSSDNLYPQKGAEIARSDLQLNYHHELWVDPRIATPGKDFQMRKPKGEVQG